MKEILTSIQQQRIAALSWPQFFRLLAMLHVRSAQFSERDTPDDRLFRLEHALIAAGFSLRNRAKIDAALNAITRVGPLGIAPVQKTTAEVEVFLCYNRKDLASVRCFKGQLEKHGLACWMDEEQLLVGKDWRDELARVIAQKQAAVVFLGPNGLGKTQRREITELLARYREKIIQVLVPARFHDGVELPQKLREAALLPVLLTDSDPFQKIAKAVRSMRPSGGAERMCK